MVRNELYIDKYDWFLRIYYAVQHYHTQEIIESLIQVNCPEHILKRVYMNLQKSEMDTGFTYSNKTLRETVMVIGLHSSRPQFINSLEHELRHMVDDISDTVGMDSSGEDVAYLTGDINQMLASDIEMFMCGCNHCQNSLKSKIY